MAAMHILRYGESELEYDPELTRAVYRRVEDVGPYRCSCIWCKNFFAARDQVYPPDTLALLQQLGVTAHLEAEVVHYGRIKDGLRLYEGWWPIVGNLLKEPPLHPKSETVPFHLSFRGGYLPVEAQFRGLPLVYAVFWAHVPWVIPDAEVD